MAQIVSASTWTMYCDPDGADHIETILDQAKERNTYFDTGLVNLFHLAKEQHREACVLAVYIWFTGCRPRGTHGLKKSCLKSSAELNCSVVLCSGQAWKKARRLTSKKMPLKLKR